MANKTASKNRNSTNSGSLAEMGSLSEAFSLSDFSNIGIEEVANDPAAAKIFVFGV